MKGGPANAARRAHAVDLLRLVASFQMITGHTVAALLEPSAREGRLYAWWDWARGLTAVAFMLAAGLAYHLSTLARIEAHLASPEAQRARVRRALMLIGIGYAMHFPIGALSGDASVRAAAWSEFASVDVLQCIGVTLLLLEALTRGLRDARRVALACGALAVAAVAIAPWLAPMERGGIDAPLVAYLTRRGGSLFPLVPWSGFVLGGVAIGALALPRGAATSPERATLGLVAIAAVMGVLGAPAYVLGDAPSEEHAYAAWPPLALVRIACVLLVTAALSAASARLVAFPRWARTLAGETLVLYVAHLMVLYVGGVGLARVLGPTLSLPVTLVIAAAQVLGCSVLALGWARWSARRASGGTAH